MRKVVIGIVEDGGDGVLLVERMKNDGIKKSFPSGDMKEGETEEIAVCREILEETDQHVSTVKRLGERISPYDPEITLCYWQCKRDVVTPIICEKGKIANAWYAHRHSLTRILGSNIFQPVKEYLGIK